MTEDKKFVSSDLHGSKNEKEMKIFTTKNGPVIQEPDIPEKVLPHVEDSGGITESTCWKWTRTICLIVVWVSLGSFMEIAGPTLKDLVFRIGTDYEAVSGAVSGRSAGKFVGSILGGFLVDKFGRFCDLFVAFPLTIGAVTTVLVPWVYNTDLLWFIYFVLGCVLGTVNIAGQRIILATWLEKAASPLHLLHLGYGIGGFIAPLIANPFLADEITVFSNITTSSTNTSTVTVSAIRNLTNITTERTKKLSNSRIEYAYGIVAVITVCVAAIFYFYQCHTCLSHRKPREDIPEIENVLEKKRSLKEMLNPASCASGNFCFGLTILLLMFSKYFIYTGEDRLIGTFVRSFAVDQLDFSKDDGSYVNTIYWIFYSVGRFVTFIATRWVSVKIVLLVESISNVGICICMVVFAVDNATAMWVLTGFLGFVVGPMFPTGIAWGNYHLEMTGLAITWVMLGSATGGLLVLKFSGLAYDFYGPVSFVYILLGCSCAVLVLDVVLTLISILHKFLSKSSYELNDKEK